MIHASHGKALATCILALFTSCSCVASYAIDNPDAPDYIGQFRSQAQLYEAAINEETDGKSIAEARGKYLQFLDDQLNEAYRALLAKLPEVQQEQLRQSQKAWLRYCDAESTFIDANWTPAQFGSSSTISRYDYRTSIIRDRIEQLFNYLKNY